MPNDTNMAELVLVILNLSDGWLTHRILKNGGREVNPIMRMLMEEFGVIPALFWTKAVLVGVVLAVQLGDALWAINALFAFVVIWNARQLWQKKTTQQR